MKIDVDEGKCIGIGMCEAVAPHLFAVRDDGTLEVLDATPHEGERAAAVEAVAICPTMAIRLLEG